MRLTAAHDLPALLLAGAGINTVAVGGGGHEIEQFFARGQRVGVRRDTRAVLLQQPGYQAGCPVGRERELLPLPEGAEPVSLGEPETPLIELTGIGLRQGTRAPIVKDDAR